MELALRPLLALAKMTISDPKKGAGMVMAMSIDRRALIELAVLTTVLGVLLSQIELFLNGAFPIAGSESGLSFGPVSMLVLQLGIMAAMIGGTLKIGQVFGGKGDLDGSIKIVVWLQFMNLIFQLLGLFLSLVFAIPSFAVLMAAAAVSTWLFVNFIAVLHGFQSLWRVFGVVVASYFALSLGIRFAMGLFEPFLGGT